jgi:hypothetical protein
MATWTLVQNIAVDPASSFIQVSVDLSALTDQYIRFTRNGTRVYYIDDIVITDGGGGPPPGPGGSIDATGSVGVSATVAGQTSLTVTDQNGDGSVSFGSITLPQQKASEYLEIDVTSNYGGWQVQIYTDNFPTSTPDPADWGYAYGGIVDIPNLQKVPLGWCAFDESDSGGASEPTGNPSDPNRWTWVKDKSDIDDPATTTSDESWAARGGYANVCWGVGSTGYVVNPNATGSDPIYTDAMTNDDVFIYLETAALALPGDYTADVYFDLVHE